jgi:hypothetical protein
MDPDELSGLVSLEELWMGKNKIEKIQGLDNVGSNAPCWIANWMPAATNKLICS